VSVGPNQRGRAVREQCRALSTPGRWPSLSVSRPRADPGPPAPAPPGGVSPALRPGTQGRHGGGAGSNMHPSYLVRDGIYIYLHFTRLLSSVLRDPNHYMHQISVASSADLARGDPENKCEGCGSSRESPNTKGAEILHDQQRPHGSGAKARTPIFVSQIPHTQSLSIPVIVVVSCSLLSDHERYHLHKR
jgi:hypothetical protein